MGNKYILVITDRYTNLTQVVCLWKTTSYFGLLLHILNVQVWYTKKNDRRRLPTVRVQISLGKLSDTWGVRHLHQFLPPLYQPTLSIDLGLIHWKLDRYNRTMTAILPFYVY